VPHPLRRDDRAITDPDVVGELLRDARYATIALADGDEPYVVTLSCGYDAAENRLCFHVAPAGRKLDIIARNPRACATIVTDLGYKAGECAHPFRSVVMEGRMRLLDDLDEARAAMRVLIGQLEEDSQVDRLFERHKLDGERVFARMRVLVFEIDHLTAKEGE
jgi:nitroimidazol reductase NimA-like FMN-containing flavoprotein (pyridoxamine 5'-phosphate oxidase superfamily)